MQFPEYIVSCSSKWKFWTKSYMLVSLFHNFAHNTVIKNTNYQWAWEVEEETMYQQIKNYNFHTLF